jgi:tellurite methyltransferase
MKVWDHIWQTEEERGLWLEPDPFVVSLLRRFKNEGLGKVLDLGFGLGRHAVLFAKEGFDVYGIDSSPAGLKHAHEWAERESILLKLEIGEMSDLPFESNFFDLVLAWSVIYHGTADYISQTITEIERCLKPGGHLLCTLISTRNSQCGLGEEIERGTFVIPGHQEKSEPHHYFEREEIDRYLKEFALLKCEDVEQFGPGSYHWHILAMLMSKTEEPRKCSATSAQ